MTEGQICNINLSNIWLGKGSTPEDQAGFWGSLNAYCDIPLRTFENALKFIAEEIKVS